MPFALNGLSLGLKHEIVGEEILVVFGGNDAWSFWLVVNVCLIFRLPSNEIF